MSQLIVWAIRTVFLAGVTVAAHEVQNSDMHRCQEQMQRSDPVLTQHPDDKCPREATAPPSPLDTSEQKAQPSP